MQVAYGVRRLLPEMALRSALPRSPTAVTMLVTATVGRLGMLPGQCASWGGVLSAAVYVAHLGGAADAKTTEKIASAVDAVRAVFNECASPHIPQVSWVHTHLGNDIFILATNPQASSFAAHMLWGIVSLLRGFADRSTHANQFAGRVVHLQLHDIPACNTFRSSLKCRTENASAGGCQLDVTLFSEEVADKAAAALFPVNALRNAALLAASTPLVMLGDADLLVGISLNEALADPVGCALPLPS